MLGAKYIRSKINSIKNIEQITKAMEMVAASKINKIQERVIKSNYYAINIKKIVNNLVLSKLEYKHSYLESRVINSVGYLIISTDRGLCGALNSNLFKKVLIDIKTWNDKGKKVNLILIGSKAVSFFNSINFNIIYKQININNNFNLSDVIEMIKVILELYNKKNIDRFYIANNKFINNMNQKPSITQLLPLLNKNLGSEKKYSDYLYESDPKILINTIFNRYVELQIYQSILENLVSEYSARMLAMKNATDSSNKIIKELQLIYNKARQSHITQDLIEIIFGSNVV